MRQAIIFLVLASAAAGAAPLTNSAERPKAEPVQEERYGTRVEDPYRWMESAERAEDMTAWIRRASDEAVAQLNRLPERAQFAAMLEKSTRAGVRYSDLRSAGRRLFYRRLDPADRVPKLVVRENGKERILFDPAAGTAEVSAISNYVVSPDGRTVALHIAKGGGEVGETRFLDVVTGAQKSPPLGPIWGEFEVSWLTPGHVAFTRMTTTGGADPMQNMQVAVAPFGAPGQPKVVLGAGVPGAPLMPPTEFPWLAKSPLSEWVIGGAGNARADRRVFLAKAADVAAGQPRWLDVADYDDQVSTGTIRGDRLYLLTSKQDSNGTLVERRISATGLSAPKKILSGGDTVLSEAVAVRDGLYVAGHRDGIARLLYLPATGGAPQEVKLPFESSAVSLREDEDGRSVTFGLTGWFHPLSFYRAERTKVTPLGVDSAGWEASKAFTAVREEAVSADGTRVPMVVLLPAGGKTAGGMPTILEGYASYGSLTLGPGYSTYDQPWLAQGGSWAFCGARGGGERGRKWHEGGRSANKPRAHEDYIACAERLIAVGYTTPRKLIATGTSAGGLLAPPAALMRPDLFTALIPRVAILNATRLDVAPNGPNQFAEMGDPGSEAGYKALAAQDAYLMLASARDAPDMLITVGLNDRRVAPWFAAKFAARALERFGDKKTVLVRADAEGGHGIGSARDRLIAEWADTYAFAWSQAQED